VTSQQDLAAECALPPAAPRRIAALAGIAAVRPLALQHWRLGRLAPATAVAAAIAAAFSVIGRLGWLGFAGGLRLLAPTPLGLGLYSDLGRTGLRLGSLGRSLGRGFGGSRCFRLSSLLRGARFVALAGTRTAAGLARRFLFLGRSDRGLFVGRHAGFSGRFLGYDRGRNWLLGIFATGLARRLFAAGLAFLAAPPAAATAATPPPALAAPVVGFLVALARGSARRLRLALFLDLFFLQLLFILFG
jgi:hypothetical protein